jgi:hypothetical protein
MPGGDSDQTPGRVYARQGWSYSPGTDKRRRRAGRWPHGASARRTAGALLALSLLASACVILPGRIEIGGLLGGFNPEGLLATPPAALREPFAGGAVAQPAEPLPASAAPAAAHPEPLAASAAPAAAQSAPALQPDSLAVSAAPEAEPAEPLAANAAVAGPDKPLAASAAVVAGPPAPVALSTAAEEPLLPRKRIVAYYGNPLATGMGVLGEQPLPQTVQRLRQQAEAYAKADPTRPVQLALELITPVAQGAPGQDGLYRLRMAPEVIDQVAELAEREHLLLILDVQIGQSTVADELEVLLPYLERPYVHLALDPEFAIADKHGEPGEVIGTLDAADVNYAIGVLTNLVTEHHLPPKVLIVHRFLEKMLTNYRAVQPTPSVQVVIDMDGFGTPYVKAAKYDEFVHEQGVQYGGVKLFYKHDKPVWTPADALDRQPAPDLIIYQ